MLRTCRLAVITLAVAPALIGPLPAPTHANTIARVQDGPDITQAADWLVEDQIATIAETVLLTPDQLALLREMKMEGDRQVFAEMQDGWISQEKRRELIDAQDWEALNGTWEAWQRVEDKKEEVKAAFMEDLKLVLTEDQLPRFESVERRWRREEIFENMGGVNFGLFDLHAVIREMELSKEHQDALKDILTNLEINFDRKLLELRDLFEEADQAGEAAFGGDAMNIQKMMDDMVKIVRKIVDKASEIRDLSRAATAQSAALLPQEIGEELTKRAKVASFPLLYEGGPVDGMLARVELMDTLTDDQRAQLEQIRADYEPKADRARDRLAEDIYRFIEDLNASTLTSMFAMGDPEELLLKEFKDTAGPLAGIYNATSRRIYQLLSPEQREAIEEPELLEPKDIFDIW